MKALEYKNFHIWKGTSGIMLSNEDNKQLQQFSNINDVINWLFLNGEREAARYFNNKKDEKGL